MLNKKMRTAGKKRGWDESNQRPNSPRIVLKVREGAGDRIKEAMDKIGLHCRAFEESDSISDLKKAVEMFANIPMPRVPPTTMTGRFSEGGIVPPRPFMDMDFGDIEKRILAGIVPLEEVDGFDRKWTFSVSHPDMFCPEEVAIYVDRDDPLAFATSKSQTVGFIHDSIIAKAALMKKGFPIKCDIEDFDSVGVFCLSPSEMTPVIEWVREVKNAVWDELKQEEEITVFLPKV